MFRFLRFLILELVIVVSVKQISREDVVAVAVFVDINLFFGIVFVDTNLFFV